MIRIIRGFVLVVVSLHTEKYVSLNRKDSKAEYSRWNTIRRESAMSCAETILRELRVRVQYGHVLMVGLAGGTLGGDL